MEFSLRMSEVTEATVGTKTQTGGLPPNVSLHSWAVAKVTPRLKHLNDSQTVTGRHGENLKNYTSGLHILNATGYVAMDDDLDDAGFTDVQTFILAGIATIVPLLVVVATIVGIRFFWRRCRARKGTCRSVLHKTESAQPLKKVREFSLSQELQSIENQFMPTPGKEQTSASYSQLLTPKSNGSIITMTLKNNHLIVETEETSSTPTGIRIESQGTTTKFVTPAAPDFRFESTSADADGYEEEPLNISDGISSIADHGALVHYSLEERENDPDRRSYNTGLSQSDLSESSMESQNPSYCYGNQMGYEIEECEPNARRCSRASSTGPKERRIYESNSSTIDHSFAEDLPDPPFKNILISDVQAQEKKIKEDAELRCDQEEKVLRNESELTTKDHDRRPFTLENLPTSPSESARTRRRTPQVFDQPSGLSADGKLDGQPTVNLEVKYTDNPKQKT